jgi:hypothetical protein
MDNPTIVVTWEPKKFPFYGSFAVLDAQAQMPIRIKGAGFKPEDAIKVTICEKDTAIGKAIANKCGAFEVHTTIPALPLGVVSVKAWVGENCKAYWPLDIVKELPNPPK